MLKALTLTTGMILAAASLGDARAQGQDAADTYLRVNRLEGQVRQLSGQIEQLQFENRKLSEQLRRFQEDMEFRMQDRGGARSGAAPAARPSAPAAQPGPTTQPQRRGDVFDPAADPDAPGAPLPLGTTPPSGPQTFGQAPGAIIEDDETAPGAPLDINGLARRAEAPGAPAVIPAPVLEPSPNRPSVAAIGPDDPRESFDAAFGLLQSKQFEAAEMGFRRFLQSHPRDRLVPDAVFLLGESYFARQRYEEAGQQFLKVTTDHPKSAKAPDALVRLGVTLAALGAREQACATFAKAGRDYPQAESVRRGLDRERQRARCAA